MSMQMAINHMNTEHQDANLTIAKFYGKLNDAKKAIITNIDSKTLHLLVDDETAVEVPFINEVSEANVKDEIISLLKKARANSTEEETKPEDLSEEVQSHIDSLKSAILATISPDGYPCASYSPFITINDKNYIYLSKVAEHYNNLENNPKLEILFLADESDTKHMTVRKRVKFRSTATKVSREIPEFESIMDELEKKIGSTIKMVRKMNDFNLFEVKFIEGRYVKGFGQAHKLIPNGKSFTTEHIVFDTALPHQINK